MNNKDNRLIHPNMKKYKDLAPDLWPRMPKEGPRISKQGSVPAYAQKPNRAISPPNMGNAIYLTRNLAGRTINVSTTPVLLIDSSYAWPFMILNPATSIGLTTTVTGYNAVAADGATTASLSVAGYSQVHVTLDITAMTGGDTWDIYAQSYDSISAKWVDTQVVFNGITATGSQYAFLDTFGVGTDMRFRFDRTAGAGTLTCSLGVINKDGVGGSNAGLVQSVFLGAEGVTTTSGFPILEGKHQTFIVGENVQLWAVALTTIDIKVFQL